MRDENVKGSSIFLPALNSEFKAMRICSTDLMQCSPVQADIFSFGVLMYELLCGCITSQLVVGPTGNMRAAEVYAAKASSRLPHSTVCLFTGDMVCVEAEGLSSHHAGLYTSFSC